MKISQYQKEIPTSLSQATTIAPSLVKAQLDGCDSSAIVLPLKSHVSGLVIRRVLSFPIEINISFSLSYRMSEI